MASIVFKPSHVKYDPDLEPARVGFDPAGPWQMVPHKGDRHTTGNDQLMTPGAAGTWLNKADAARMNP